MFALIAQQAAQVISELIEVSCLKAGDLLVIGCSSSEIVGEKIGKGSSMDAASAAYRGIAPVLREKKISLAVQCCEHLNRALILEERDAERFGYEIVNVVPQPKAGVPTTDAVWKGGRGGLTSHEPIPHLFFRGAMPPQSVFCFPYFYPHS